MRRAFLITFYRPFTKRLPEGVPSINQTTYQSAIRAKVDAAALQTNTILDALAREKLLNFAGPMTWVSSLLFLSTMPSCL
jgi:hypothetical protein